MKPKPQKKDGLRVRLFLLELPVSDKTDQAQNKNTVQRARKPTEFGPQLAVGAGVGAETSTLAKLTRLSEPRTIRKVINGVNTKQRAK